jgi:hypothetical protein
MRHRILFKESSTLSAAVIPPPHVEARALLLPLLLLNSPFNAPGLLLCQPL